mmetsp:Transcript_21846/g.55047  ORF Transcript_21846/g.55047 Transcript_21846/m.55047 type:complete len:326 (-) Transcript_21846:659-1636(-)
MVRAAVLEGQRDHPQAAVPQLQALGIRHRDQRPIRLHHPRALAQQDVGSAFHVEPPAFPTRWRITSPDSEAPHALALAGEGEHGGGGEALPDVQRVVPREECQLQQGPLRLAAHPAALAGLRRGDVARRGVQRDGLHQRRAQLPASATQRPRVRGRPIAISADGCPICPIRSRQQIPASPSRPQLHGRHAVLGQCTRLVRQYRCGAAHGFAGVQLPHQVVLLQHLLHAEGQRKGDCERQPLGHRHDEHGDAVDEEVEVRAEVVPRPAAVAHDKGVPGERGGHQQPREQGGAQPKPSDVGGHDLQLALQESRLPHAVGGRLGIGGG